MLNFKFVVSVTLLFAFVASVHIHRDSKTHFQINTCPP